METTFISVHDLTLDARLLYVSNSIEDILGYSAQDVINRSCWEFFHPDEIPFAQSIHGRSVQLDKAAVLNYCRVKNKQGRWVGCECVFTIVHDVLVASTSVYRRGPGSQRRAIEAPVIRQLFSSSPRDPRYHMLSYISQKFSQDTRTHTNEPRAALFLNRFSRTLAIMFATNGLAEVLGLSADQLIGKSFYYCIQENCLREAVKCLESAKANDSIAYLRFWFRNPTQDQESGPDEHMSDGQSTVDDDDGGVHLSDVLARDRDEKFGGAGPESISVRSSTEPSSNNSRSNDPSSRSTSGNSLDGNDALFDQPAGAQSSTSSLSVENESQTSRRPWQSTQPRIELEAVVSCTSDGLVVVLRAARPQVAQTTQTSSSYANGLFAVPWASNPIIPGINKRDTSATEFPSPAGHLGRAMAAPVSSATVRGPSNEDFMNTIRDVVVFAWSLTGINGSLARYGRGNPSGESQPPTGLPIWDPYNSNAGPERPLAIERAPNALHYSPVDGTPIYERMDIDEDPRPADVNQQSSIHLSRAQDFGNVGLTHGPPRNVDLSDYTSSRSQNGLNGYPRQSNGHTREQNTILGTGHSAPDDQGHVPSQRGMDNNSYVSNGVDHSRNGGQINGHHHHHHPHQSATQIASANTAPALHGINGNTEYPQKPLTPAAVYNARLQQSQQGVPPMPQWNSTAARSQQAVNGSYRWT